MASSLTEFKLSPNNSQCNTSKIADAVPNGFSWNLAQMFFITRLITPENFRPNKHPKMHVSENKFKCQLANSNLPQKWFDRLSLLKDWLCGGHELAYSPWIVYIQTMTAGRNTDPIYYMPFESCRTYFVKYSTECITTVWWYICLLCGLSQTFVDCLRNEPSSCWICMKFDKMSVSCLMSRYVYSKD